MNNSRYIKDPALVNITSPLQEEEGVRRNYSSAVKFIRARGLAESEAKRQIDKLNLLMNKRKKREEKVAKNLKELEEYRVYKVSKQEERRSAAKTRVMKKN